MIQSISDVWELFLDTHLRTEATMNMRSPCQVVMPISTTLIKRGFIPALGWPMPSDPYDPISPERWVEIQEPFLYKLDESSGVFGITDERGILWVADIGSLENTRVITDDMRGFQQAPWMYLPPPHQIAAVLGKKKSNSVAA